MNCKAQFTICQNCLYNYAEWLNLSSAMSAEYSFEIVEFLLIILIKLAN